MIVFGVISTLYVEQIRDFYSKSDLIELTNELEAKNIHFVYSRAGLLQWQITFYSNERVISRYTRANDRYPKYIDFVNHAWAQEKGTAIIDYSNRDFAGNPNTKYITDKFSLLYNPTKEELQKMGFEVP